MAETKEKSSKKLNSDVPPTELELRSLQELYLQDKNNQVVVDKYFLLLRTYARSLILKKIKKLGIFLPPERVDELSTDVTLLLIKSYSKPGWKIGKSFAGAIKFKILEAMYHNSKDEMNSSLNQTFSEDKDSKEVLDVIGSGSPLPWDYSPYGKRRDSDDPADMIAETMNVAFSEVVEILNEAYNDLPYRTYMRFVPWLVLQFRKPKTKNIQTLFNRLFLTSKEENVFDMLLLEIHNRISQHVI